MITFIAIVVLAVLAFAGYRLYTNNAAAKTAANQVTGGVSAFARVAEAEGKLIALKSVTAAKTEEAKLVHVVPASQEEPYKLLG